MTQSPNRYDFEGSASDNQQRVHPTPRKGRWLRRLCTGCRALAVSQSLLAGCSAAEEDDGSGPPETAQPEVTQQAAADGEQAVPAPHGVTIEDIRVAGSGCPDASSFEKWISSDKKIFSVSFFNYSLESATKTGALQSSLYCDLTFKIKIPEGYAYRITSITYAGRGDLPRGVTAKIDTKYQFVGTLPIPASSTYDIPARGNAGWTTTQKLATIPLGAADCDVSRDVLLNTRLTLEKLSADLAGAVKLSATSGEIEPASASTPGIQLNLLFFRCPKR